jgi:D-alanyl-D-alanine carboxypeptidase
MLRRTEDRRTVRTVFGMIALAVSALSFISCATPPRSESSGKPAPSLEAIRLCAQEQLDEFRERVGAPGATVGFVLQDGRSAAVASGVSNKTTQRPMRPTDCMLAGSIGKTHVAAVLLQLYEERRVDLDTKISHWFGDEEWFAHVPNAEDITLRMLMNHTSGMPEHVTMPEMIAALEVEPQKVWQPEELVAFVLDKDPLFPAGEGWSYADTNYIFVGMIIERVTGRTYYQELADRILKPLGLRDTIPAARQELPGLVSGYTSPQNPFPVPEEVTTNGRVAFNPQMEWTGGGLMTTSLDLARWAHQLYGGNVLKQKTKTLMLQGVPAGPRLGPDHEYGLGVIIRPSAHGPVYGHAGWFPGYISMMAYYADHGLALAIQTNTDTGVSSAALEAFLDELADRLIASQG